MLEKFPFSTLILLLYPKVLNGILTLSFELELKYIKARGTIINYK